MTVETYLKRKYRAATAQAYERDIKKYLQHNPQAKTAKYADVLRYLELKRKHQSPASLNRILQSIKKYYNYLIASKQRADHPCCLLYTSPSPRDS